MVMDKEYWAAHLQQGTHALVDAAVIYFVVGS
jgi:hypothetical protein